MKTSSPERHEFQAEVKQVLDIVVHSLYTNKEIFIRELISNASDASEKLRHTQITEKEIFDAELELEIQVTSDEEAGQITIQDFGIGMTREELIENLGTIAHSGSKAFLNALKESGEHNENLIGQFGVGFYSAFMVAEKVEVYTRTWHAEGECLCWTSDGSGAYEIQAAEGERRGTRIVLHLKDEFKEFAKKTALRRSSIITPLSCSFQSRSQAKRSRPFKPSGLKTKRISLRRSTKNSISFRQRPSMSRASGSISPPTHPLKSTPFSLPPRKTWKASVLAAWNRE
jgi:molecular chaperone HtpG